MNPAPASAAAPTNMRRETDGWGFAGDSSLKCRLSVSSIVFIG
jgi:hypothetical protein